MTIYGYHRRSYNQTLFKRARSHCSTAKRRNQEEKHVSNVSAQRLHVKLLHHMKRQQKTVSRNDRRTEQNRNCPTDTSKSWRGVETKSEKREWERNSVHSLWYTLVLLPISTSWATHRDPWVLCWLPEPELSFDFGTLAWSVDQML